MKNILISANKKTGTIMLTTNSPLSSYGKPVLRIKTESSCRDFGPADLIGAYPQMKTAAETVVEWARKEGRTEEEIYAARSFLSQWFCGPRI